jgi:hypothetical protein
VRPGFTAPRVPAERRQRRARRRSLGGTGLRYWRIGHPHAEVNGGGGSQTHIRVVPFLPLGTTPRRPQLPPKLGPSLSGHVAAGQRNHFTGRRSGRETKADYQRFPTVREIRVRQMIEAVAAILGLFSASVFLAHAVDAYRTP